MNENIAIPQRKGRGNLTYTVSGRQIHAALSTCKRYHRWANAQIDRAHLIEGVDFVKATVEGANLHGGRPTINHHFTTEAGNRIEKMFIDDTAKIKGSLAYNMVDVDTALSSAKANHTSEDFHRMFRYDQDSGNLYWRVSRQGSVVPGDKAGTVHNKGYLALELDGTSYLVHRVIWCMLYGRFPDAFVDHRDLDRSNNRQDNLRAATRAENNANQCTRKDNTSGVKGVSWHRRQCKWVARVQHNGRRVAIGYYTDIKDAENAVKNAREELHKGFSNHG